MVPFWVNENTIWSHSGWIKTLHGPIVGEPKHYGPILGEPKHSVPILGESKTPLPLVPFRMIHKHLLYSIFWLLIIPSPCLVYIWLSLYTLSPSSLDIPQ